MRGDNLAFSRAVTLNLLTSSCKRTSRYRKSFKQLSNRQVYCTYASYQSSTSDGNIIGIDLGTSNSAVAVIRSGSPIIIPLESGKATIPSIIALGKDPKDRLIGVAAQQAASADPLNTFYSVKRLIGRPYASCYREAGSLVYKIVEGPNGETQLWSPAREMAFGTEEISGMILEHLINCAANYLGTKIEGAVIAVPAHFNETQRKATLEAAKLAGLSKIQLLQEPVAAAMAYGLQHDEEEKAILVFDLGGGTYDVSLLEGFEGIFEVLATGGDSQLGGDDWDKAISEWCLQKCTAHLRMAIRGQPGLLHQLYESARLAKVQLSSAEASLVHVPGTSRAAGPSVPITRRDLEEATKKLRLRLGPPLEALGRECHVEWAGTIPRAPGRPEPKAKAAGESRGRYAPEPRRISQVVLVGSATRIPSVRRLVGQATGVEPCSWVNPEECVALGAAIQAGVLLGSLGGLELADGSYAFGLHSTATGFQGLPAA